MAWVVVGLACLVALLVLGLAIWSVAAERWVPDPDDPYEQARAQFEQGRAQLAGFASGGVVHQAAPSDDRVPFALSQGCAWVPADAVRLYGEDYLRRLFGVEHLVEVDDPEADG